MDKMDTSNGIAWFGNIFQKFEDMYHDVDELVKQAESQLVTVGANVKNFFTELDLIGDAVPQSSVDKKLGAAPGTSVVQKNDDAVGVKSLEGTDGGCGAGVHIGSVESVKSVSSGLSLEQIDDNRTPDKKDSINANQEIGVDIGAKLLIPASDAVGECNSFTEPEDRSTNLVDMSSKFSDEKKDSSNENEEIGLDSGAKLLIPSLDDIGGFNSFMETEDRSRNLVDLCSKNSDDMRLSKTLEMDILCKKSTAGNTAANLPIFATEPEGLELYDSSSCDESETTTHFPGTEEPDNDVTDSGLQTLGSLKKVELGESCIVVDCTELECSSGEAVKRRSYKKKLRDAFVSRMRLLKKQNNDELRNSFATLTLPEKSNSPNYEFCESDWEIV